MQQSFIVLSLCHQTSNRSQKAVPMESRETDQDDMTEDTQVVKSFLHDLFLYFGMKVLTVLAHFILKVS